MDLKAQFDNARKKDDPIYYTRHLVIVHYVHESIYLDVDCISCYMIRLSDECINKINVHLYIYLVVTGMVYSQFKKIDSVLSHIYLCA